MQCAICHDDITAETGRAAMSCSHEFHIRCLVQWLQTPKGSGNCPCCRKEPTALERLAPYEGSEYDSEYSDEPEESEGSEGSQESTDSTRLLRLVHDLADPEEAENTSLMRAIVNRDVSGASRIIESGHANLEAKDSDGDTALYWALLYRQEAIITMLLAAGANILALDPQRTSLNEALMESCKGKSLSCIRACLDKGADVNYVQPVTGITPLISAIRSYCNIAVAEFLVTNGASVTAIDSKGWNAIMWAAHTRGDDLQCMEILLSVIPCLRPKVKESIAATKFQTSWRGFKVRHGVKKREVISFIMQNDWFMARMVTVM